MLDKLLDKVFDFAASPRGIVTLLAALTSAAERDRGTRPTGGGVTYGMAAPRRLQQVGGLGRYQDVVRFDDGGPTISVDEPSPLLWGLTQGPYGPLLAYDIGPRTAPRLMAPETSRQTEATQGYVTGQEGSGTGPGLGMGMSPQQEAALDAAIASGAHGRSMAALNQTLTDLVNKSTLMTATRGLADFLSPLTAQLTGQADGLSGQAPTTQGVPGNMAQAAAGDVFGLVESLGLGGVAATTAAANAAQAVSQGVDPATAVQNAVNGALSTGMADIAESGAAGAGPAAGDSGTGVDAGDGFGVYAQGGSVFTMQDGGFVLPKDAVKGAGGPRGIAQILPQARMIGGPPDPTGKRDLTPAKIVGPNGVTPARVSRGEAYVPPEGVRQAGGARQLYNLMNRLQRGA
jgi:hypothetical protein